LFTLCNVVAAQGSIIDETIYSSLEIGLLVEFPDKHEKVKCMVEYLKWKKVVLEFYSIDLLTNNKKLIEKIKPFMKDANNRKWI
jgi:hypothetical protein